MPQDDRSGERLRMGGLKRIKDAVFNDKTFLLWEDIYFFHPAQNGTKLQRMTTKTYKSDQFTHQFRAGQHVLIIHYENRLLERNFVWKKSIETVLLGAGVCTKDDAFKLCPTSQVTILGRREYTKWANQGTLFVLV